MENSGNVIGGGPFSIPQEFPPNGTGYGTIDLFAMAKELFKLFREGVAKLDTLNVMVLGKTGVGKSTLINAIFKEKMAETGIGAPVTKHMKNYTKKGVPLKIYDSVGLELKNLDEIKTEITNIILEGERSGELNKAIHCIWYCINCSSNRVEDEEINWIENIAKELHVPVIIVLTQCISKSKMQEMRNYLVSKNLSVKQVVPVLAETYDIDDNYIVPPFGLKELIRFMIQILPETLLDTLNHVQIACLEEKTRQAQKAVRFAAGSAAVAAATPIHISDRKVLIPIQLKMMARISVIFGLDLHKDLLLSILTALLGTGGATIVGTTLSSIIIKYIPGVGSVVGGLISSGTAGAITYALGNAYIKIMERIYKGELSQKDLESGRAKQIMKEIYQEERAKN